MDFYQAVAGLIPILVLAVVLEMPRDRATVAAFGGPTSALLVVGLLLFFATSITTEVLTLTVLKNGGASPAMEDAVEVGLVGVTATFVGTVSQPMLAAIGRPWLHLTVWGMVIATQLVGIILLT